MNININSPAYQAGIDDRRVAIREDWTRDVIMDCFIRKWRSLGRPEEGHARYAELIEFRTGFWSVKHADVVKKVIQTELF